MVASHTINRPAHESDPSADQLAAAESQRVRHLGLEPERLSPTQSHLLARDLIATDRSITHIADAWGFTYAELDRAIDLPHIRAQLDAARRLEQFRAELTGIALRADALRALSRIAELPLPDPSEPGHDERHLRARAELLRRANSTLLRESRHITKHQKAQSPNTTHPIAPTPNAPTPNAPTQAELTQSKPAAPPHQPAAPSTHQTSTPQARNLHQARSPTPTPTRQPSKQPKPGARAAADLASKAGAMPTSSPLRTHEAATDCSLAPALLILPAHPADTHRRTPSLVPD